MSTWVKEAHCPLPRLATALRTNANPFSWSSRPCCPTLLPFPIQVPSPCLGPTSPTSGALFPPCPWMSLLSYSHPQLFLILQVLDHPASHKPLPIQLAARLQSVSLSLLDGSPIRQGTCSFPGTGSTKHTIRVKASKAATTSTGCPSPLWTAFWDKI